MRLSSGGKRTDTDITFPTISNKGCRVQLSHIVVKALSLLGGQVVRIALQTRRVDGYRKMSVQKLRQRYCLAALVILFADVATSLLPVSRRKSTSSLHRKSADFILQRTKLHAKVPSFDSRFEKWRFLQDLLDGDVEDEVLGELLIHTLNGFLNNRPPQNGDDTTLGSPELTPDLVSKLQASVEALSDDLEVAMTDFSEAGALSKLKELLPDPIEDEDANKSVWDTVMEIHGQDMVRANEGNPTAEWRKLCLIARLLIHFDFLSKAGEKHLASLPETDEINKLS